MTASVDLSPQVLDIKGIRAGDRNLIFLAVKQSGVPIDLTGLTPRAQVRAAVTDADELAEAVITVTDATGGTLTMQWLGEDVRKMLGERASFKGVWDLQLESSGSDPLTIFAGSFAAVMDVTR